VAWIGSFSGVAARPSGSLDAVPSLPKRIGPSCGRFTTNTDACSVSWSASLLELRLPQWLMELNSSDFLKDFDVILVAACFCRSSETD
jgi:hypothetical protein